MNVKKVFGVRLLFLVLLFLASSFLLGGDRNVFIKWWLCLLTLGIGFWPLAKVLLGNFADKGWLVSKILGIAGAGFLVWLLTCCHVTKFNFVTCLVIVLLCIAANWGIWYYYNRGKSKQFVTLEDLKAAFDGELVFVLFFLLWTYVAGFRPEAYGTEKFMDYGFMMAMMRSEAIPAPDMWYAGENLNYYYGGQYFAVFLTKLTRTEVAQTYNLMRTMIAGFAFALPFVLVRQMVWDFHTSRGLRKTSSATIAGVLAGAFVSLAGNMHYLVVGKLEPLFRKLFGLAESEYSYWFPNSTRYIGYYPEGNDKTIHEFPSYSFILGDLHAHVVNIMFVLAFICIIYAMVQRYQQAVKDKLQDNLVVTREYFVNQLAAEPYILVFAFFIGLFHWTNYWDFVIYFVMGGFGVIYCNYLKFSKLEKKSDTIKYTALLSLCHAVWIFALATVFALPFTMQFDSMANGIALAQNHSRLHQWWLIWGVQFVMAVTFFVAVFVEWKKKNSTVKKIGAVGAKEADEEASEEDDFEEAAVKAAKAEDMQSAAEKFEISYVDWFGIILGVSALGLILIPELVYVRDIYEAGFARANTMFKLTYQAFTMFGLLMAYMFARMLMLKKQRVTKVIVTIGLLLTIGTCGYIVNAVGAWFGDVQDVSLYKGLDATAFLENSFASDAAAIDWLNQNVEGNAIIVEAQGDSYSDYERVSAMTGLPTIMGWYVHEWLWRGEPEELNQRQADLEVIYTADDEALVRQTLDLYNVEYVYVGRLEREKYANINERMLSSLGEIVFTDRESNTYIVKVK